MTCARNATLPDVPGIHAIIQPYAETGVLLPRSLAELSENIRDFVVVEENGSVAACGALHLYGMHLAELRSVAVAPDRKGRGCGRSVVSALLEESRRHGVSCVCLFTRTPDFFAHLGFALAQRSELPDKIYKDCVSCPKLNCCDEIAMVVGTLPSNTNGLRDPRIAIPFVQLGT